ncbi:MAG: hypothetical protein HUJ83_11200, partial [Veillonella sp.]|nr:hypothetical protein [Veillonella sp.]
MGRYYHMNIEAYEMYFNRDYMAEERGETSEYRLPLDALEFSITNQMATHTGTIGDNGTVMLLASDASVDKVTLGADGKAVYSFYAGFPNYSDDYTLPLSMRTEIHGQTLTYPPSGETFKGIVLGQNDVPGSNFVTAGPNMVDFVLRDPPGSNSYATLESGSTLKAYHSLTVASTVTGSVGGEISVGPTITISEGTATISNISETNVVIKDEGELTINNKNEDYNSWSVAYSLDKSMSTSSSPEYVGADGDVFIGCSSNITIAQAKKLDFVPSNSDDGCLGQRDTKYVLATKDCLSTGAKYNTDFIYTQKHIKESLIPMLYETRKQLVSSENIVNDFNSLPENTTSKPK